MDLNKAGINKEYSVTAINSREEGMSEFLLTLGCFPGEKITVISRLASNLIINIKDARYSIDDHLASAIIVEERTLDTIAV